LGEKREKQPLSPTTAPFTNRKGKEVSVNGREEERGETEGRKRREKGN